MISSEQHKIAVVVVNVFFVSYTNMHPLMSKEAELDAPESIFSEPIFRSKPGSMMKSSH